MKAEIDENGQLSVIPETPVETFALKQWWEDYMRKDTDLTSDRSRFAVLHVQLFDRA